eukprot:9366510-Lingulodinium_polyedra.AAC.1
MAPLGGASADPAVCSSALLLGFAGPFPPEGGGRLGLGSISHVVRSFEGSHPASDPPTGG